MVAHGLQHREWVASESPTVWQCCKRSPIYLHQVVNDLRSQPDNNVVATFGNSVATVGDSVEAIGGVCDISCIIFWKMCEKKNGIDAPRKLKITVLCSLLMRGFGKIKQIS